MLCRIVILCLVWALPAAAQDELLGTWEHSQDGIEVLRFTWEHIDALDEWTPENATVSYDTLAGQRTSRVTFSEDGTFHLNSMSVYDSSDFPAEALAELEERGLFDSTTYDGIGTWHSAGDSLWIEYDEFIMYQGDTEIRLSEFSAEEFIREQVAWVEISEEDRAALEALFLHIFNLFIEEQMEFAGTYHFEGDSLFLTSLGLDGVGRTRAYTRTTAATAVTHTSWGALKANR